MPTPVTVAASARPAAHPLAVESGSATATLPRPVSIPGYLQTVYWWAYVHPRAVRIFERPWLVNAILFGHYARLRDAALDALGHRVTGRTLQVACVYGNLTPRLCARMAPEAQLDVVDILPVQLDNLRRKLPLREGLTLVHADASDLPAADASYDQVLMFFLLHEQPEAVRRASLAEAVRVLRPGGRLVVVDYHRPAAWHPLRPLMRRVFHRLEPYAMDLWRDEIECFLPPDFKPASRSKSTWFGGLYQLLVMTR